ncbi:CHAT domain-containing tetratricopeptide repeat protein [Uliginosibacterium gangwonense]|uniref:CHAT domain-containing tetratricopeptide repeat protein n=1 Tax=Uliginosibacterium gangwonense TaxID=392736 RepID=UPI00037C271C|nr:CHAT domain-containing tetratricopeptide repeat protein [Uliginosibacterium gangwonense]
MAMSSDQGAKSNSSDLAALLQELQRPAKSVQELPHRIELCVHALALVSRNQHSILWAALQNELGNSLTQNPQGNRAENLERSLHHHQEALVIYNRTDFPEQWAITQNSLANAYLKRIRGKHVENLEQAIHHYQEALAVRTRESLPTQWAATQSNLALAYSNRICGERAENLELAIHHHQKALTVRTRESFPEDWAATQNNLALAYSNRICGEHAENLEQAIHYCHEALMVYTRESFPEDWAMTLNNLAVAFSDRILGERSENLEQAIYHYREALEVRTRESLPEDWAATQNNLALAYSNRICGERAKNMEQAIRYYQEALTVYTRVAFPEKWATAQNNLAIAYSNRTCGEHAENIEQAIRYFREALAVRTRESFPEDWAATQSNLALAYSNRIYGERAKNMEQAIRYYQETLSVCTRAAFPEKWAVVQNNLAIAYSNRIYGERAENLEQAIYHYREALAVRTRESLPEDWAATQNNLALAYRNRICGERTENLERAIHYYKETLAVYTHTAFPELWAMTQSNLALAYSDRICGKHDENLEQAIHHYQEALIVYNRTAFPGQWATAQNNLAVAYKHRVCGDRAENLECAIHHHLEALAVRTRDFFPEDWAATQHNLANAYLDRISGEREENLEQAILRCQEALTVRTRTALPEQWGMTQNSLALAYSNRICGDRAENVSHAIHHYQEALKVRTRSAFPTDYRQTQRNLGDLYFRESRQLDALIAYQRAIEAGNDLLALAYSEVGRQAEVRETTQLYARTAYCLLRLNRHSEALEVLERGKTRLLAETMALSDLDMASLSIENQQQLQSARLTIKELEAEMRLPPNTPARRDDRVLAERLLTERSALNSLVGNIRRKAPDFLPLGLSLDEILQLIPPEGALVAPLFTSQGSAVFVIPQGTTELTAAHVVQLDAFQDADLDALLRGTQECPGWLTAYGAYLADLDINNWKEAIESLVGRMGQAIIAPIQERLTALKVKRLLVLPSGGLQLLPLHSTWFSGEDGQRCSLLDDYEIAFAPSAHAYSIARRRLAGRTGREALVVGINDYAQSPLVNAIPEAQAVAALFNVAPLLDTDATKGAVISGAPKAAYLHFSCHGSFNWSMPMDSTLCLANNEMLTLSDVIGKLDLRSARLVTLSACETGISDASQSPDEYLGLPAGFLQAGTPALISSLWSVDDRCTALLMDRFYHNHILQGMRCSAALREAQLWLRGTTRAELGEHYKSFIRMSPEHALGAYKDIMLNGAPDERPYANPYYWAAFTFNGADV